MSDNLRDSLPDPPRDVVSTEVDTDFLDTINRMVGQPVTITEPGELLTDSQGVPLAVGASTSTEVFMARPVFSRRTHLQLGLTSRMAADRWPHIKFI